MVKVSFGSWSCKNAKTLNRDRRSYSSKTDLVAKRATGFNLESELKNIILARLSRHVRKVPTTEVGVSFDHLAGEREKGPRHM